MAEQQLEASFERIQRADEHQAELLREFESDLQELEAAATDGVRSEKSIK